MDSKALKACSQCSLPPVSVCSFEIASKLLPFRGCGEPFCKEHGVPHEVPLAYSSGDLLLEPSVRSEDIFNQRAKKMTKEDLWYLSLLSVEDHSYFRCCNRCFRDWRDAILLLKQQQLVFLMAVVVLIVVAILRVQEEKCDLIVHIESKVLQGCFEKEVIGPGKQGQTEFKDYLKFLEYRTGGSCILKGSKKEPNFSCFCPKFEKYDRIYRSCIVRSCQSLQMTGKCLDMNRTKMQKSPDISRNLTCPLYRKFNEHYGTCLQIDCPFGFEVKEDGNCRQCPPYSRSVSIKCSSRYLDLKYSPASQHYYLPSLGLGKCPRNSTTGEYVPFKDELGNVQCSVPSTPIDRECRPEEIVRKMQIGCRHECPPYEDFDPWLRECQAPTCRYNQVLLKSGTCHTCPSLYSRRKEVSNKYTESYFLCLDLQTKHWPESKDYADYNFDKANP